MALRREQDPEEHEVRLSSMRTAARWVQILLSQGKVCREAVILLVRPADTGEKKKKKKQMLWDMQAG